MDHPMERLTEIKKELRRQILRVRDELDEGYRREASRCIVDKVLTSQQFQKAEIIFSFVPFGSEVDIRPVVEEGWRQGKGILVPKVDKGSREMKLHQIFKWDDLERGYFGILEPHSSCPLYLPGNSQQGEIDLILMPGLAFDRTKGRLGYGGGYYDRFIGSNPYKPYLLAVTFDVQIVPEVPQEPWDYKMDEIISETDTIS